MRIIISPAKKMRRDTDSIPWTTLPEFLPETAQIYKALMELSPDELKRLWRCNDAIADLNVRRLQEMDFEHSLTPAVLSYDGIQYQHMAPNVFTDAEFSYIQEHLRILSGFYGILKPFDGVTPYRLEMQAKLRVGDGKDLYSFWGDRLAKRLLGETDCIVNLASKEYSISVSRHLPDPVRFITCVFGELQGGKIIEKGTMCKMARGEMARFMAENRIEDPEDIQQFDRLGYRYMSELSECEKFTFIANATGG